MWRVLPVAQVAVYGPHADTGYSHRPGVEGIWTTEKRSRVSVNVWGFVDRDVTLVPEPGVRRVALTGASQTEALQVSQDANHSAVAERLWNADHSDRLEVLNLGIAGATPAVQLSRLRSVGLPLAPELAILFLGIGEIAEEDMADDLRFPGYVVGDGGGVQLGHAYRDSSRYRFRQSEVGQAMYWLLDRFRVARIVNSRKNVGVFAELRARPLQFVPATTVCAPAEARELSRLWLGRSSAQERARLAAFLSDLGDFQETYGVPLVLALSGLGGRCFAGTSLRQRLWARVQEVVNRAGLTIVDVDAELHRRVPDPEARDAMNGFGSRVGHLNEYGHRVFGDVLLRIIEVHLPPPADS